MKNKILKIAKFLKTFTFEDLVMMSDLEVNIVNQEIQKLLTDGIITKLGKYYEYLRNIKPDGVKVINKNHECKNSDITVIAACEEFLEIKKNTLTTMSFQTYKTFTYAQIVPFFRDYKLKDVRVDDIQNFKNYMLKNKVSERRIKNILCFFNQIIKYYQNEGLIDTKCVFEVKRIAKVPKRQIQVLTNEQIKQLFKIFKNTISVFSSDCSKIDYIKTAFEHHFNR